MCQALAVVPRVGGRASRGSAPAFAIRPVARAWLVSLTAVYGGMLYRHPLRFLLADDPGAGKTIMAGLLIKELLIRGSLERCLIIAPGSLVEQWQDELSERFDLAFDILSRDQAEAAVTGNPFAEKPRLIARLDMPARNDALKARLEAAPVWDLVVCDEAHRMSASFFGQEGKEA